MRTKRMIITCIVFICLYECASYKIANVVGIYNSKWENTDHTLKVNSDSTFIFYIKEEILQDTIKGKWLIVGKNIILKKDLREPFYKIEYCSNCSDIKLLGFDVNSGHRIFIIYKTFYDGNLINEGSSDSNGIAYLKGELDSVYIESLEYKPLYFVLDNNKQRTIEVYLAKKEIDPILDIKWRLKNDQIVGSNGLILKKAITNKQ